MGYTTKHADWGGIEADYRANILSLRAIAKKYSRGGVSVSYATIKLRAEKGGWAQNLQSKIHERAEEKLARTEAGADDRTSDRAIIEANAARIAQVRGEHRADVDRARGLCLKLFRELETQTGSKDLLEQLPQLLEDVGHDHGAALTEAFRKAVSLPGRIDSLKKMAETLKTLVTLEREAYGIDKIADAPKDVEVRLDPNDVARRMAFLLAQADKASVNPGPVH